MAGKFCYRKAHTISPATDCRRKPNSWTWANVGRGLVRMAIPYWLIRGYRMLRGRAPEGELVR